MSLDALHATLATRDGTWALGYSFTEPGFVSDFARSIIQNDLCIIARTVFQRTLVPQGYAILG